MLQLPAKQQQKTSKNSGAFAHLVLSIGVGPLDIFKIIVIY
ncbi:hypothetical protein Ngar_c33910 [Candidatus Nitrososphaera gargensis Ga9.2]|uniref:Uncharacterized protein n=1 Tax=Nitrososphaera gargensis (strain Ga9.2) TaxID=1237085 RepID=K0IFY2_NITGG|nr:hypothetical protein Ngar_c33910 [Candidatus Nitrososphaera gargensis Ga9.2]